MQHWREHKPRGSLFTCDAEIGRAPNWHVCNRPAVIGIEALAAGELHYCAGHAPARLADTTGKYFKRAPFAEPRNLVEA